MKPWHLLGALVLVQWAAVLGFALTVRHNGWLYYQGGDQIFHYTSGWLLGHGQLGPTRVAYQWPALLAPVSWLAGPSFVSALPWVVLVNVLVLLPLSLVCVYVLGTRLGGRWIGTLAAVLWVVMPWLGIRYALPGYHAQFVEQFLPQALGLTAMVDFPALVALLVAAVFTVRALETRGWADGAFAGLATGVAIGFKASDFIFLPFPLLALAVARRWRQLVPFGIALIPALATLALWKERGLGNLPAFSQPTLRVAADLQLASINPVHKYVHLDWRHLYNNILGIKEHFWSVRLVQWAPLAGLVALARRSRPLLLLYGGWFFAFLVIKGTYQYASTDDGSFFRFLMPAYPAFLLLIASLPLLVPRLGRRLRRDGLRELPPRASRIGLTAAVALFGVAPFAAVAVASPVKAPTRNSVELNQNLTPVSGTLHVRATRSPAGNRLAWRALPSRSAHVFYYVFRAPRGTDEACSAGPGAASCQMTAVAIKTTRTTSFIDTTPGTWTYRVGAAANWLDDTRLGDVFLLSPPISPGA